MNCREVREKLTDWLENALAAGQRAAIERHLADCEDCTTRLRALKATRKTLRSNAPARLPDPGEAFNRGVWARIDAESTVAAEPAEPAPHSPVLPAGRARRLRPAGVRPWGWRITGIAAAILLAFGWLFFEQWRQIGQRSGAHRVAVGRLQSAQGAARLARAGRTWTVSPGEPILAGDRLLTSGREAVAVVRCPGMAELRLGPRTAAQFLANGSPAVRRVFVESGVLTADVAPRNGRPPLLFSSTHADVQVLGTLFSMHVAPDASRIALQHGELLVRNNQTREAIRIRPGYEAVVTASTLVMSRSATADLRKGLVAYWPFDETDGDVLIDHSGNEHHGTIYGAARVDGRFGRALRFGGQNDRVDVGNPPKLRLTGAMTLSAWVFFEEFSGGRIVNKQGVDPRGWSLNLEQWGTAVLQIARGPQRDKCLSIESEPLLHKRNTWVHLAGVFEPGRALKIFVDGQLSRTRTDDIPNQQYDSPLNVHIGRRPVEQVSCPFAGRIDEVRVYDRALSDQEIAALYQLCSQFSEYPRRSF
ncbi:MAG: zf-HC2 domain-containing protein [Kiritimatiellae bacterium]|nr:zf-HC2 domain-containing protein [Kiritimatiellia bacterium]